ncbi:class I SAM-dependent methyltransferase [Devosia sp. 63-57]|mgnify:CR=1 FL=1|uniref:class I SAM-dependent methyltransferase n=1 Tax=Devosia sp. 63-57 TaxID=1895751 RepID=UPI0008698B42|nr:class I SAM-dependent methyltransferase [Devosia sp. 63-57]ODT50841.1 MAG: SAM-dependent methyltransferase [Pelagibacterium sp. SCN 63-126]ODU86774.1 MAG: SAM-dependent methyltransferase [Pelagibacterium sp. SCN 63-17]OJX44497.1 MAG: SAM-dependent methyltransferase [Devosia sp. 63-57]
MSFWDERYSEPGYLFGEAPNAFLAAQQHRLAGYRTALAIADGEGRNGVFLAEQGLDVTSIDASSVGIAKARALAEKRGVSVDCQLVDIAEYEWPADTFDVVVGIFFQFAAPPLRDAIFAGMIRTLAPGGLLLLEGYGPRQMEYGTGGPRVLENLYTEDLLADRFKALEILDLRSYDAELSEGSRHRGVSALVDLVARKPGRG